MTGHLFSHVQFPTGTIRFLVGRGIKQLSMYLLERIFFHSNVAAMECMSENMGTFALSKNDILIETSHAQLEMNDLTTEDFMSHVRNKADEIHAKPGPVALAITKFKPE